MASASLNFKIGDSVTSKRQVPCGLFVLLLRLVSICFSRCAPLSPWLIPISAVKPQTDGTPRPWLETTVLATSTARISSCAHTVYKVIVALIGKAIPPGRSLACGGSPLSLASVSRYRGFLAPLLLPASTQAHCMPTLITVPRMRVRVMQSPEAELRTQPAGLDPKPVNVVESSMIGAGNSAVGAQS